MTYEISQTENEQGHKVTYKRVITIEAKTFYGKTRDYQRENCYRNSQLLSSNQYPADTDYAKSRLEGLERVN